MRIYESDAGVPDISTRYELPRYYIPAPLHTTAYLFVFVNTSLETAKEMIDTIVESKDTIKGVKIYAEADVESDFIEELQTYLQKRIDLDNEDTIEVLEGLTLLQVTYAMIYLERGLAYREALQN